MEPVLIFLSSGLFLGWSLGANDTANVFGTAVTTKMLRFKLAAVICSLFVVIGSVTAGAGASGTLGKLGSVNAIAGSFTVALAAGLSVFFMNRRTLPVSTSQAIVGAIIGWNMFAEKKTDLLTLTKIVYSWVLSPLIASFLGFILYKILILYIRKGKLHMIRLDQLTRMGLILVGAFGSYSLGANNIANVMGVFVPVSPFRGISIIGIEFSATKLLFLIGALAISLGVFTYSRKVMTTVGSDIFRLSPLDALVVVLSSSIVLFLFASESLKTVLLIAGLPSLPLVPVSSSQTVVGAVIGIAIGKGGKNINLGIIGKISLGWVMTPVIAGVISFIMLFFMQNVFMQTVYF